MNMKEHNMFLFLSYSLATLILSGVNETSADKVFVNINLQGDFKIVFCFFIKELISSCRKFRLIAGTSIDLNCYMYVALQKKMK